MDKAKALNRGNVLLTYFLDCIAQGKPKNIKDALSEPDYPDLTQSVIGTDLSLARMASGFILPQAVRAAISGGMSWMTTKAMYLDYVEKSRQVESVHELTELHTTMLLKLAEGTARIKEEYECSPLVRKCSLYLDEHIYEPLTVRHIASVLGISPGYLSHIYKKEKGEALRDCIRRKKLSEAKWLLKHTSLPVAYICSKLSYCSQSYFTDVFRKACGMTPCQYRNQRVL